ncbi:metallophosphoesterase [Rhizobium ruizarguesonis]|uniref:metallophosphoesterase n=1 Tax=Rhizobium ruizarguesonis TaxID=2081791 RepID=UPI0037228D3C
MKAWIFSDLHLEVNATSPIKTIPDADVCICAGDIFTKGLTRSIKYLGEHVSPHMPVLFVPGNHEYWGSSLVEGLEEGIREADNYPDVHILHRKFVHFGGFRFAGATFWSDLNLFNSVEMAMLHAKEGMNDFRRIMLSKKPFKRFSVRKSMELHWQENAFIQSALWHESTLPLVVITHHAPSILSVPREFIDDPVAPMFASRFEKHIIAYQPRLWVHGHLHNRSDYMIQRTRVICNPYGYASENETVDFDPAFVVDLSSMQSDGGKQ